MSELWNVDLHSHTLWSKDCLTSFDTILHLCHERGIDRIAITDHNTAEGALALQKIAPDQIIVGEEIMTTQGEILAYFVQESIPAGLSPEEAIRRLRDQRAVISIAHPFDRLRKGAWQEVDLRRIADQVDAIEIFNARCLYLEDNERALKFAKEYNLPGTAGSDGHSSPEYGMTMTRMQPFESAGDFLASLKQADYVKRLSPAYVHLFSKAAKWTKKLRLRQRLWKGG